jgi:hypothetical protein
MKKLMLGLIAATTLAASVRGQVVLNAPGTYSQNFNSLGTSATAALPTGFRIFGGASPTWTGATGTAVTLAYGTTGTGAVTGTSSGGIVNWADGVTGSATDRALGFLNTGSFTSPQSILFAFTNSTGSTVTSLNLGWDYEKYRSGSRAWDWTFFTSADGSAWTSRTAGDLSYAADANNTVISNPAVTTASPSFSITGLSIADGQTYYLRWTLTGNGGSSNGQGLAIDNFSLAAIPEPSTYALIVLGLGGLILARRLQRSARA